MRNLRILLLLLTILSFAEANGQSYNTAGGMRFGSEWGLTFKQRLADRITAELMLTNNYKLYNGAVDLTFQFHNPVLSRRMNFYYGAGAQLAFKDEAVKDNGLAVGVDLIGGLEITINRLNISWDLTPTINVYNHDKPMHFSSAVSARYVINKRNLNPLKKEDREKIKKKRQKEKEKKKKVKAKEKKAKEKTKAKADKTKNKNNGSSRKSKKEPEPEKKKSPLDIFKKKD